MRVPLDSEKWQSLVCEPGFTPVVSVIESWQLSPPSPEDFGRFVEAMGCSDCVHDSYYFSLPYLLDEIDKSDDTAKDSKRSDKDDMILHLRLQKAAEQSNQSEECQAIFESCLPRLRKLLIARLDTMPSRYKLRSHLVDLAACYGDPELALEIERIDI